LDTIPNHTWDEAAENLLEKGVATVRLSKASNGALSQSPSKSSLREIHAQAFRSARSALDRALYPKDDSSALLPTIAPEADSAHVTGFHRAGGMSRYNVRREGIVFSDENCSCNDYNGKEVQENQNEDNEDYRRDSALSDLSNMFWSLHGIADRVLLAIETKLELSENLSEPFSPDDSESNTTNGHDSIGSETPRVGWFQRHLGPTNTASQWHMKRFLIGGEEEEERADTQSATTLRTETGERITLPMHTDPSLISVVIHDSHGVGETENDVFDGTKEAPGALGLQYFHPKEKRWEEPEAHGHQVATVFVGSVLAHLTCGIFPAAKHRVIETSGDRREDTSTPLPRRMAATLFVRPQRSAILQVPLPSPWLLKQLEAKEVQKEDDDNSGDPLSKRKKKKAFGKPPITFDAWLKRVAKNYEKQKKKQKNKNRKAT